MPPEKEQKMIDEARVKEMRDGGMTLAKIGEEFGISKQAVGRILDRVAAASEEEPGQPDDETETMEPEVTTSADEMPEVVSDVSGWLLPGVLEPRKRGDFEQLAAGALPFLQAVTGTGIAADSATDDQGDLSAQQPLTSSRMLVICAAIETKLAEAMADKTSLQERLSILLADVFSGLADVAELDDVRRDIAGRQQVIDEFPGALQVLRKRIEKAKVVEYEAQRAAEKKEQLEQYLELRDRIIGREAITHNEERQLRSLGVPLGYWDEIDRLVTALQEFERRRSFEPDLAFTFATGKGPRQ
jgi:hypothetical protein